MELSAADKLQALVVGRVHGSSAIWQTPFSWPVFGKVCPVFFESGSWILPSTLRVYYAAEGQMTLYILILRRMLEHVFLN